MKIVRWMSMMTMAAAMLLAGCSESINDGEGTDDGGLGNSGGNGSGNGGNSGLVIEDSLNKETSIVGVWYQEEQTNRWVSWIFRADGTCTRVLEVNDRTESEDSGIYQYADGKLVTSVIPTGSVPFVFNVQLATENQLVLENANTNTNVVFKRITVDDEPADNILGYWVADYYYKDSEYSSHNDIVIDRECEDYIVDLSQRSFKVKDKESGEVVREYYIGYISNKFMELFDKERKSSHLYYKNEEYNIDYGYPTATITETECKVSETSSPIGGTRYSYWVNMYFNYTGLENIGRMVVNIGSVASEDVILREHNTENYYVTKYISSGTEKHSSFYITIECYIKGCNYPIRLASTTAYPSKS